MGFWLAWLSGNVDYDLALAAAFVVIVPMELVFPRREGGVSWTSRARAVLFWLAWVPVTIFTMMLIRPLWLQIGVRPLIASLEPAMLPRPLAITIGALAAAFVGDFFYYWCHRAQHRIGLLWRFHAVHHSVRELSGVAAYHHVSEELIKILLYSLPLSFFIDDPLGAPVLGAILGVQGHYLHSATRLNLGPLGRLIQDNRFHRIHHSIEPAHWDKNFGVVTTLWDWLFGTAHFPAKAEWPATGVEGAPEPAGVADFYLLPFRLRPALAGAGAAAAEPSAP
jgi:sterol desaturase/sphingolipid hydroxylase (fatty acid hydroxylase superfamily)